MPVSDRQWKLMLPQEDEVHIWRMMLDVGSRRLKDLFFHLSPDERERADSFRFTRDREHFITARGSLREILAAVLRITPSEVAFSYGAWGKPHLACASSHRLHFNLTHSHGVAILAIALGHEVGIDVEAIRPEVASEEIARRFFSPAEAAALCSLPAEFRTAAFFRCWTRKEAFVKATGMGLSLPLDSFDVSLLPGEPVALLATRPDAAEAERWKLAEIDCGPGFTAALAVQGQEINLNDRSWPLPLPPRNASV